MIDFHAFLIGVAFVVFVEAIAYLLIERFSEDEMDENATVNRLSEAYRNR